MVYKPQSHEYLLENRTVPYTSFLRYGDIIDIPQ